MLAGKGKHLASIEGIGPKARRIAAAVLAPGATVLSMTAIGRTTLAIDPLLAMLAVPMLGFTIMGAPSLVGRRRWGAGVATGEAIYMLAVAVVFVARPDVIGVRTYGSLFAFIAAGLWALEAIRVVLGQPTRQGVPWTGSWGS